MEPTTATILVVDESRQAASALADRLRGGGFTSVYTVADPRETAMRVRELRPDVVAIDHIGNLDATIILDQVNQLKLEPEPGYLVVTKSNPPTALVTALLQRGVRDVVAANGSTEALLLRLQAIARPQLRAKDLIRRMKALETNVGERDHRLHDLIDLLRKAEQRLQEQLSRSTTETKEKSELLAIAAHELRSPLHAIIGFAELLHDEAHGPLGDKRYVEYASDIQNAANQLLDIVNDTLDLAKANSGEVILDLKPVDIGRVVEDGARLLRQFAAQSGVLMSVRVPDTPLMIRTDPDKVRQVVVNLATNAIKFTPRNGQVIVDVRDDGDGGALILVVRDTGSGMTPTELANALIPFRQSREPVQPQLRGSGLGLPLTQRFVEMLGGTLEIESQPGQGTTVTVRLPADADGNSRIQAAE